MTTSINDAVIAEIDDLVVRAEKLSREASRAGSELGFDRIEELSAIANRGGQLIRRLYEAESQLRKLAATHNVPVTSAGGKALTIDPLNVALAKAGAYGPLVQKQVTTWSNLRNDAAHGHFEKYDQDQVKQMLLFVQKCCADYLG